MNYVDRNKAVELCFAWIKDYEKYVLFRTDCHNKNVNHALIYSLKNNYYPRFDFKSRNMSLY